MTFVRTKIALERLPVGGVLEVRLQGDEPLRNVPDSARDAGHTILASSRSTTAPGGSSSGGRRPGAERAADPAVRPSDSCSTTWASVGRRRSARCGWSSRSTATPPVRPPPTSGPAGRWWTFPRSGRVRGPARRRCSSRLRRRCSRSPPRRRCPCTRDSCLADARVGTSSGRSARTAARTCLGDVARELGAPDARSSFSVQVGTLLALLIQRRALGLSPDLEGLLVSDTGVLSEISEPTCTHRPPVVPADVLTALVRHLAAALPDEGCAVLVGRGDSLRLVPMENAQAAHHARDPDAFPRSPARRSASIRAPGSPCCARPMRPASRWWPSPTRTRWRRTPLGRGPAVGGA